MLTPAKAEEILGKRGNRWVNSPERYLGYFTYAKRLLKERGWCQGAYARDSRGRKLVSAKDRAASSFCAQGALERIVPEYREYAVCKKLLGYAMDVLPSGRTTISAVNDGAFGTSKPVAKAEVYAGYDIVILVLKELNGG
jgi:hypothetical protein